MDLNDTPEQAAYREKVRSWLEEHKGEAPVLHGEGATPQGDRPFLDRHAATTVAPSPNR